LQHLLCNTPKQQTAQPASTVGCERDEISLHFTRDLRDCGGNAIACHWYHAALDCHAGSVQTLSDLDEIRLGFRDSAKVRLAVHLLRRTGLKHVEQGKASVAMAGELGHHRQHTLG
jgi:hypothetical protein